jgi:hypothetical protein
VSFQSVVRHDTRSQFHARHFASNAHRLAMDTSRGTHSWGL